MLDRWRVERARRESARAFVRQLLAEPDPADVTWLADHAAKGDVDHAAWELRYARRAAGVIVARRDALDDRTASLVSGALSSATQRDPLIDSAKRHVAARQLNARLAAYSDAISKRTAGSATGERLGRVLLFFAGLATPREEQLARAGQIIATYLADAHDALRREFGDADLPRDIRPSQLPLGHSAKHTRG